MIRRGRATAYAAILLALIAPRNGHAQSGRIFNPEDRVLISDFNDVTGLTRDNTTVYAVTPNGVVAYDFNSRRFRLPLTREDGFPFGERPLSIVYAQSSAQLLIGTAQGGIYSINTLSGRFENISRVNAPVVQLIAPTQTFDIYAGSTQSWYRLRSGSFLAEPVAAPPAIVQPGASDPYLRAALPTAASFPGRFNAEITALVNDRTDASYYIGTRGNGIVHLDTRTLEHTRLPFGLNTRGATSVARWRSRIFFGGDVRTPVGPLVSASESLEDFREYPPNTGAPQDQITALLATDSALWVGTSNGLYSFSGAPGRERWQTWTREVADLVTSLTENDGAVYAGSERGLIRIANGTATTVLTGRSVYGLAPARDTLWIACDVGLAAMPLRSGPFIASALQGGGSPGVPAFDVRSVGDTLYATTRDALFRRGPSGWVEPDRSLAARLGPMGRLRTDGSTLWVLGTLGFAAKGAKSAVWAYYMAIDDIPEAPVRDLLPLSNAVWLATPAGALRVSNPH